MDFTCLEIDRGSSRFHRENRNFYIEYSENRIFAEAAISGHIGQINALSDTSHCSFEFLFT